jgi:hypothetical protein
MSGLGWFGFQGVEELRRWDEGRVESGVGLWWAFY